MTVYCITRHYRAMDDWFEDENYLFTDIALCKERLKYLNNKRSENPDMENGTFIDYSITEKSITFIESSIHLDAIHNYYDHTFEELRNYEVHDSNNNSNNCSLV